MSVENFSLLFETPDFGHGLLNSLFEQQKSGHFCDVTIYLNNTPIKLHRNILAGNSNYFASILKQKTVTHEQLTVTGVDNVNFDSFLTYMYTGKILISSENIVGILGLANYFLVPRLVEFCKQFLEKYVNFDNCFDVFEMSKKFEVRVENLEKILLENFSAILNSDRLKNLSSDTLLNFIQTDLFLNFPAIKILEIFTSWVSIDLKNRSEVFPRLLNALKFSTIDHNEISKHLDSDFLYANSDRCFYDILNALIQNNILLPNYKNRYEELHYRFNQNFAEEPKFSEEKGIEVTEKDSKDFEKKTALKMLIIKAKKRSHKQKFLRRLMLWGLKPNLRIVSQKTLFCKKKISVVNIRKKIEETYSEEGKSTGVKCPICFTVINDSMLLEQHLALSHAKDVTYKCGICTFVCQYHGDYLTHMKNHFPGPPYKCDYCDHTCDQISKLLSHRAHHIDEMVYHCTFCTFKCRSKPNLLAHLRLHTSEKNYQCPQCDKTFRFKRSLEQHSLTHSAEKTLNCDQCGFTTKFVSHMIAHKRMHSGDGDIYRCSFPHCKYSTSKKSQLSSHTRSHNGVRPHNCTVCGRGFMEKSHLVRHERIHLDEKPFKCSQCDYASSRRDKLKEHFTRHHGENASAKVPYKARPLRNGTSLNTGTQRKNQETQNSTPTNNGINFSNGPSGTQPPSNSGAPTIGNNEIQDLIMHHQNHPGSTSTATTSLTALNTHNYHHFGDPTEFHHHHGHNLSHNLLAAGHAARSQPSGQTTANTHHMLARASTGHAATSTAAAVAAAMMLDPRFHHNGSVPYHPNTTPVSMAMAAVQSSQQIQNATQHGDYPPSLQNCMTLF